MDSCASVCAGHANIANSSEIQLEHVPYTKEEPELLQEFARLSSAVAKPQEMLTSLKLQHAAIQATMLDMEDLLSNSLTQLSQLAVKVEEVHKINLAQARNVQSIRSGEDVRFVSESFESPQLAMEGKATAKSVKPKNSIQRRQSTEEAVEAMLHRATSDIEHSSNNIIRNKSNTILEKVRQQQQPKAKALPPISGGFWPFLIALCKRVTKSGWFECVISAVIVANSIMLGVESQMSLENKDLVWASQAEVCFLVVYTLECMMRAIAERWGVLRDGWFLFDVTLVVSAYVEQFFAIANAQSEQQVMVLRAMRLIRLVRTFRMIKQIRSIWRLVYGLITCGETMISTYALLGLVIYVFGVLGLELISNDENLQANPATSFILSDRFSSLGVTMITLTQFTTMDSIAAIYLPLIKANPWLIPYFFLLMVIISIALMNLVTAVIVEGALEHARQDREEEQKLALVSTKQMLPEIVALFDMVDMDQSGEIVLDEMRQFEESRKVPPQILDRASVDSMTELFEILDVDNSGKVNREEFVEGLLNIFLREVPVSSLQQMKMLRLLRESVEKLQVDVDITKKTIGTALGLSPR